MTIKFMSVFESLGDLWFILLGDVILIYGTISLSDYPFYFFSVAFLTAHLYIAYLHTCFHNVLGVLTQATCTMAS